ncbi:MAG TPA: hypothetical protein VHC63_13515 [Acidimicrobiales bacterium]|nr:hypothetical protein [Acidimicrobiales bacterium]
MASDLSVAEVVEDLARVLALLEDFSSPNVVTCRGLDAGQRQLLAQAYRSVDQVFTELGAGDFIDDVTDLDGDGVVGYPTEEEVSL